jgi:hypothetical protein
MFSLKKLVHAGRRFKAFARRHRGFLTLLGAVVAFATFVINYIKRENLKDLVAAIDNGEDMMTLRRDNNLVLAQLKLLQLSIVSLDQKTSGTAPKSDDYQHTVDNLAVGKRSLERTTRLLRKLPDSTCTVRQQLPDAEISALARKKGPCCENDLMILRNICALALLNLTHPATLYHGALKTLTVPFR